MNNNKTTHLTFDDIKDEYVQAYNRLVVIFNLNSNGDKAEALKYISSFSNEENLNISRIAKEIQEEGWVKIKKRVQDRLSKTNLIDDINEAA